MSKQTFNEIIKSFGLQSDVIDAYGFTEQMGVNYYQVVLMKK